MANGNGARAEGDGVKRWILGVAGTLVAGLLLVILVFFARLPGDVAHNAATAQENTRRIEGAQSGMEAALAEIKVEQAEQRKLLIEILRESKK